MGGGKGGTQLIVLVVNTIIVVPPYERSLLNLGLAGNPPLSVLPMVCLFSMCNLSVFVSCDKVR
jgi:hypothetical protein